MGLVVDHFKLNKCNDLLIGWVAPSGNTFNCTSFRNYKTHVTETTWFYRNANVMKLHKILNLREEVQEKGSKSDKERGYEHDNLW